MKSRDILLYLANESTQAIGGGWSWIANIRKALPDLITDDYAAADTYLIPSASMIKPERAEQAKEDGKQVILRVDNILRHSRNGGKGMSRMMRMATMADKVIFQSGWARDLLEPYLGVSGKVIMNSVDTDIFNSKGRTKSDQDRYLYSRYNRDETKNWEMARFIYSQNATNDSTLYIVGRYSPELTEHNFDFYNGEQYRYYGEIDSPYLMADLYRQTDALIFTYFNDACSNTLIEALCCGCEILDPYNMLSTGGSAEIMNQWIRNKSFFSLERMANQYREIL